MQIGHVDAVVDSSFNSAQTRQSQPGCFRMSVGDSLHPLRYSFVTIGFEGDAGLLRLQARSMRLYCSPQLIEEIIIVDNSSPASKKKWQGELLYQYGDLARFVRIVPASDIADMGTEAHGWFTQQVLKIEVAAIVRSERYVILDAKNHLIAPLGREFLETPTGRPRMSGKPYIDHPMQEYLDRTLTYLHLDPQEHDSWFTRTDTPFTMLTREALELVREVEHKEGNAFASVFLQRKLSEFFLYAGFLVSKGTLWQIYERTQVNEPQVWPGNAGEEGCAKAIQQADQSGFPFMTIHRQALAKLDKKSRRLMAEFWHKRSLFASARAGLRFLRDPNRSHQHYDGRVVAWPISTVISRTSSLPVVHSPRSPI